MIDILRSEWTKIRSVRSTVWTLAVTAVLMLGFSALTNASARGAAGGPVPGWQAIILGLTGTMLASLSMATLGVLVISSEYRTGGIRTSIMAVPRRMSLLTRQDRAVRRGLAGRLHGRVGRRDRRRRGDLQPPSIEMGEVARSSLGSGLYLTACGLFGLGLGTLIRHTPGAIVSAIALILVLPTMANQLPGEWGASVAAYFTTNAGLLVVSGQGNGTLGPWSGFAVYLAWVAAAVLAGAVLMQRRDA
ncbi:hypothetical protein [Nonomuraea dietziae]|uniref:hypothetical protein n=1 Tax=Nonomuraea dietziae TaxID=65515 RepID=UPI0031CEEBF5